MIQVTATEAQRSLPDLLTKADAGVGVEIKADNGRTYRLVAHRPRPPVTGVPRAGTCRGIVMADNFDEPLAELREYWE